MSRGTLDPSHLALPFAYAAFTRYGLPFQVVQLDLTRFLPVLNPRQVAPSGLGSAPFARRYLGYLV